jgi:hypothetical protein
VPSFLAAQALLSILTARAGWHSLSTAHAAFTLAVKPLSTGQTLIFFIAPRAPLHFFTAAETDPFPTGDEVPFSARCALFFGLALQTVGKLLGAG